MQIEIERLNVKNLENDIWTPRGWKQIKKIGKTIISGEVNVIEVNGDKHYLLDEEEVSYGHGIFSPVKDIKIDDGIMFFDEKRNIVRRVVDKKYKEVVKKEVFYFIELMPDIKSQQSFENKGFNVLYENIDFSKVRHNRYSKKELSKFIIGDYIKVGDVFSQIKSIYLDKEEKMAYIISDNNENSFIVNGLIKRNSEYLK